MKEIVFTPKRQKKELYIFGVCFAIGFVMNLISIIIYNTPWIETFSQLGYVLVIAIVLYLLLAIFRGLSKWIRRATRKKSK